MTIALFFSEFLAHDACRSSNNTTLPQKWEENIRVSDHRNKFPIGNARLSDREWYIDERSREEKKSFTAFGGKFLEKNLTSGHKIYTLG